MKEHISPSSNGVPAPEGPAGLIDTDYVIGQDNITGEFKLNLDIHGKVFAISALVTLFFVILTLALHSEVEPLFTGVRSWLTNHLIWFFLLSANIFVVLCLVLVVSPLGKVRIGGAGARPDFSYLAWFSMLFAAGMGIGLMFYGVSEPMSHFVTSLGGTSLEGAVRSDWVPLTAITSFVGILLVVIFFVTSSDSGSLVIDTITAGGKVDAPKPQRVFWAVIEGLIAIALLLGGGLIALQAMAVSMGLPFTLVLLAGCFTIVKGLLSEYHLINPRYIKNRLHKPHWNKARWTSSRLAGCRVSRRRMCSSRASTASFWTAASTSTGS